MSAASRYWRFVRIDGTGRDETIAIEQLRAFFQQQFPEFIHLEDLPDVEVQRRLLDLYREVEAVGDATISHLAGLCLRCSISNQIKQACTYLAAQFGNTHGFTRDDLLPCVLNDQLNLPIPPLSRGGQGEVHSLPRGRRGGVRNSFISLAVEILQTFNPDRGNLETWTNRLVKHNRELNAFLLEHGVYLLSDWAILNDTKLKQLERIFSQFHCLSGMQIQQAALLLESYHAVYRCDRLVLLESGFRGPCLPPTVYQLQQIANHMLTLQMGRGSRSNSSVSRDRQSLSADVILAQLQDIAELLRQYRIHARGGTRTYKSITTPEVSRHVESIQSGNPSDEEDEQTEFLKSYRREFVAALDRAIRQAIGDRITQLQRKNPQKSQQFIKALRLFHCQGLAMSVIAGEVGLQAQYQVTRLLNLKPLRADVRRQMLNTLYDSILNLSRNYADPERLQNLDREIEAFLNKHVEEVIEEAEAESSHARGHPLRSLFAQRLCQYLKQTDSGVQLDIPHLATPP